ncbi:hypothetical protein PInf_003134 [Phytophthora infestans]|nr:hypothetical protein PInf_003134 [Phytophthora infestans]
MIRESLCPSSPVKSLSKASLADAEDTLQIDEPEADESNQTDDGRRVFTDIDDTSLGELFKYAVVLAGPAPTMPKRSLQERHRTYRSPDSTFVLTIASASNPTEITYAICVRCPLFPDKEDEPADSTSDEAQTLADGPAQCCLCLLSPYPFFGLFFKVLYGIAVLWNTKRRQALMNKDTTPDSVATMLEKPLGMLDFVEVFQGVMERLKEMQIPSMGGWSRTCPLIAGRVSINSASIRDFSTLDRPMKDVIEMNMDQNSLHMHDEDLITYHELKLPECDELVHELEPYSALLFGKHEALDFPTVQQDEACKIMCARIHHHIESICALAMAEKDTTAFIKNDYFDDRSDHSSSADSSPSRGSITRLGADRRCSAMVADYINRFQGTQMFSMFNLQAQDAQNESEDGDIDRDDSENDGHIEEEYHYEGR